MTLAMVSKIVFPETEAHGEIVIRKANAIQIESSWETLTDTATIVLPRNVRDFDKINIKTVFKKGDPVEIYLGYDEKLLLEFTGFISEVSAEIPIKIKCDDFMHLLKKHPVNVSMRSTKLIDLIKLIVPKGIEYDVADINIERKRFPNTTVAKILEELQGNEIYSYFVGKKLIVGKVYSDNIGDPVVFNFSKNVIDNNLQYKNAEDVIIKIIANSTLPKGKKLRVEFGDDFGQEQHLSYYNITLKEELLKLAKADYDKFKIEGFEGNISAFGIPSVSHGMKAKVISYQYPDRKGLYFIKKVVKDFDDTPKYRQTIELDKKAE